MKFERKSKEELKKALTKMQYNVTQNNATEPPYLNAYDRHFEEGLYVDVTTGEPLFSSLDKFQSGCGWPSFSKPLDPSTLKELKDVSHGMLRTEVRSGIGDAHLGHVFSDGPKDRGGLRYCINSAAMRFIPRTELAQQGYEEWLKIFE
jgi:methionine-R-sulfoxide reductase